MYKFPNRLQPTYPPAQAQIAIVLISNTKKTLKLSWMPIHPIRIDWMGATKTAKLVKAYHLAILLKLIPLVHFRPLLKIPPQAFI